MEKVLINGKEYSFIKNYKENTMFRKSYNELTKNTYGFNFEQWYQDGYWGDWYVPYSLLDGEKIVANISVSIIDFFVLGEIKRFVQLGTVMTHKEYRNHGLSRYLMKKVIEEWKGKCHVLYLFANDSVLNFYPQFGFTAVEEYQYSKRITNDNENIAAEKLDMTLSSSRELIVEKINCSMPIAKLSMLKNPELIMFYCTSFMMGNVYYLREEDVIIIAEIDGDTLYLQDIFSSSEANIDDIINSLTHKEVKKVVLGFTPKESDGYCVNLLKEEGTTLFVMKNEEKLFQNTKLMFPILSHA